MHHIVYWVLEPEIYTEYGADLTQSRLLPLAAKELRFLKKFTANMVIWTDVKLLLIFLQKQNMYAVKSRQENECVWKLD